MKVEFHRAVVTGDGDVMAAERRDVRGDGRRAVSGG